MVLTRTVIRDGLEVHLGTCPICGTEAELDDDQYYGKVSVICPECGWHQTVDWSK
jgi:endogenous inhibitor of DNA gyrase (YacG/DUF329 family)